MRGRPFTKETRPNRACWKGGISFHPNYRKAVAAVHQKGLQWKTLSDEDKQYFLNRYYEKDFPYRKRVLELGNQQAREVS